MKNNKKAFSVAEAMITLLIISVALAMSAPLFSKRAKTGYETLGSSIPQGAIMYFDRASCPSGWTALASKYPDAENSFIRNISGSDRVLGSKQLDAAPNITGTITGIVVAGTPVAVNAITSLGTGVMTGLGGDSTVAQSIGINASLSSNVYGREDAIEIRPANVAFLACRKD